MNLVLKSLKKGGKKNLITVLFFLAVFIVSFSCVGDGVSISNDFAAYSNKKSTTATVGSGIDRSSGASVAALDYRTGVINVDFSSRLYWQEDSQCSNPGWFKRYQASFNTCAPGFSCSGMSMYTRQGSNDRIKYYSKVLNYSYGSYTWRLFIPAGLSTSERFSIGAFLRSDNDCREIDFEIGYGTSSERAQYSREFDNELGPRDLLLYATNQGLTNRDWVRDYCGSAGCIKRDIDRKTLTVVSPSQADSNSQQVCTRKKIRAGQWHDLTISFEKIDENHSKVSWFVSSELIQSTVVDFGMCPFQVYCSVENLKFIGDGATTADRCGYFAWIRYVSGEDASSRNIPHLSLVNIR